jgi:PTS system glucitol/sorbitol-specific IIA component
MSGNPSAGRLDSSPAAAAGGAGTVHYDTRVQAIGEMIPQFREQGLLIFFGEMAPEELHEFVIRHRPSVADAVPSPGDVIEFDGDAFTVTAVGDVVQDNLLKLGHFCLKADGSTTAPLPGDVCVEARPLPDLHVGSVMRIIASSQATAGAGGGNPSVSGEPGSTAPTSSEESP